jgi:formylglycine-generating enzyme required for sulfatase activity
LFERRFAIGSAMDRESAKVGVSTQPQVFISYARQDTERVRQIVGLLEQEGATVWRDGDQILGGQYYGEQIVHAIAHSRVVLLMCSPEALKSDNVHREVLLTWDYYHRQYVPLWLSAPMVIPDRFRYCLVGCQWIDAHAQPPEQWLPQLVRALHAVGVDANDNATPVGESATEGDEAGLETARRRLRFQPGDRPVRGADWELERLLGKGGFGEVWKAYNPDLPGLPHAALKFCLDLDKRSRELLRHEADMVLRVQKQLGSDGIVPLLHAYLKNDPPCLEYPYIEGGTLVGLLDGYREQGGSIPPATAQRVIERIAQIVATAHRLTPKLVHRDLKPSNVLVERLPDRKFRLRVMDFGIGAIAAQPVLDRSRAAPSLEGNLSSVLTGAYSPLYASPQQIRGDQADPRDDVYALGVIWFQLLMGDLTRPAPGGRRWIDALRKRGMSDAAIDLLSSCVEHEPADRPEDAGALASQLQELASAERPSQAVGSTVAPSPAKPEPKSVAQTPQEIVNSIGMRLKLIPTGEFLMGSPNSDKDAYDDEKPQHRVRITRPFYLGIYPVTQREYMEAMKTNPSHFKDRERHPVENVFWLNAAAFCNALSQKEGLKPFYAIWEDAVEIRDWNGPGYRLPTEAEWEYACRAGSETRFGFGDDEKGLGEYAWYSANSDRQTHPVGQKKPNAFGLYDVHGNVWEWCWDGYAADYYKSSPVDDPRGPVGASYRVIRGGSWGYNPRLCRSAVRLWYGPGNCNDNLGFRLALGQSGR